MKVLIFADYFEPGFRAGGPIQTLRNTVERLGPHVQFQVITRDRDFGDDRPYFQGQRGWVARSLALVLYVPPDVAGIFMMVKELPLSRPDVLYLNSLFSPRFSILPLLLRRLGAIKVPAVVLAPRGECSRAALEGKALRKSIYLKVAKLLRLHEDVVWHAAGPTEALDIRRTLGDVELFVSNDAALPQHSAAFPSQYRRKQKGVLYIVFLSRISRMKNLPFALDVLSRVSTRTHLDIYGPVDDEALWRDCARSIANFPPHITVVYKGAIEPERVKLTLSQYDLFFLPTLGENFGHAVIESLRAATPVLISDRTQWRDLQKRKAGWDLSLEEPEKFGRVIEECSELGEDEWLQLRQGAFQFAADIANENSTGKEALLDAFKRALSAAENR